ncbi:MAG TPA: oligosaccharide flippase family protein [Rudaea sp.]|jgi:O-antigen/teichoic acid export membrane protein|nr:oligosaccharide flippase family protein [Rudaea sp.]
MSDSARPGVATHYLRYMVGNVLVMIAGFVSFPIMTRLLDNGQYGILGYFDAWLLILVAVFKLGAQHTILRFYPHVPKEGAMERFGANFVLLPFLCGSALWLFALAVYGVIVWIAPPEAAVIGWIMLLLLPPTMWISFAGSVAFAQEKSRVSAGIAVAQRWLEAGAILTAVYFIDRSARGVYLARLTVAIVFALFLARWVRRQLPMHRRDINATDGKAGLRYGLPMVVNEIASTLLSFADRIMLRQLTGDFAAVGVYTIGYGLALNISNLLNYALYNAYTQVSVREFETKGPAAVVRTKRAVLLVLVYIAFATITGLLTVGNDVLLLMAGSSKAASAPVFQLIGVNYVVDGFFGVCTAGLLLHKRTTTILVLSLLALILNVAINLVWIPRFGVMGAVYATFVSFMALHIVKYRFCPPDLRALPGVRETLIAGSLALVSFGVAYYTNVFGIVSHFGRLIAMAGMMIFTFVLPALALDRRLRDSIFTYLRGNQRA